MTSDPTDVRPAQPGPPPAAPRFLPSRDLARLALEASAAATPPAVPSSAPAEGEGSGGRRTRRGGRRGAPPAAPQSAVEVLPAAEPAAPPAPLVGEPYAYGAETVYLASERLDVAPNTPPSAVAATARAVGPPADEARAAAEPAASPDPVERTRASLGIRVERMLATLAFRAAAQGQRELRLSDGRQFTPHVSRELLSRLPINPHAATPVLDGLHGELRQLAAGEGLTADWGRLVDGPDGLRLELKPFERDAESRPRAGVLPPAGPA